MAPVPCHVLLLPRLPAEDFPEAAFSGRLSLTSRFALLVHQLEYRLLQVSRKLTQSSKKNFEMYYFMHQEVHRWTTLG